MEPSGIMATTTFWTCPLRLIETFSRTVLYPGELTSSRYWPDGMPLNASLPGLVEAALQIDRHIDRAQRYGQRADKR